MPTDQQFVEAGRRGGQARAASLSATRRREIAIAASRSALLKRRGMFTTSELVKAYLARLRAEDPDLARFVSLALRSPSKYAWNLAAVLSPEESQLADRIRAETELSLEAR